MKTSLTDWLVTALAYIVICAVLSIINNEEDKVPLANQPEQPDQPEQQATSASKSAATLHASVSVQLTQKMNKATVERSALRQLTQEAERMTGIAASVQ